MKMAICTLESLAPYGQSKFIDLKRDPKETSEDFEKRTWKERCHYNDKGHVFIPPMAFKNCLSEAAQFMPIPIPGKGKATYTKHFIAGILVTEGIVLPETRDTIKGEWLFLPAKGDRGGSTRVKKCMPVIHKWKGKVTFYLLDSTLTQSVFEKVLREAGNFIGIGYFRPRNNGYFGRFRVVEIDWQEYTGEVRP